MCEIVLDGKKLEFIGVSKGPQGEQNYLLDVDQRQFIGVTHDQPTGQGDLCIVAYVSRPRNAAASCSEDSLLPTAGHFVYETVFFEPVGLPEDVSQRWWKYKSGYKWWGIEHD